METKFKKVITKDRIPTLSGRYITSEGALDIDSIGGLFHDGSYIINPEWYLEEVTDYESLLAGLLEAAVNLIDEFPYDPKLQETRGNLCMNAQSLIFDVKNNTPNLLD